MLAESVCESRLFESKEIGGFLEFGENSYEIQGKFINRSGTPVLRLSRMGSGALSAYFIGFFDGVEHWSVYSGSRCVQRFMAEDSGSIEMVDQ